MNHDTEAANLWRDMANIIGSRFVFQCSQEHPKLAVLERLGYILSTDTQGDPVFDMVSIHDDLICIKEEHKSILCSIYAP